MEKYETEVRELITYIEDWKRTHTKKKYQHNEGWKLIIVHDKPDGTGNDKKCFHRINVLWVQWYYRIMEKGWDNGPP